MNRPIVVIGAGAWGTTLAMILMQKGCSVRLWEYFPDYARLLEEQRENIKFLPGVKLPVSLPITSDLKTAVAGCDVWVMAVPAQKHRNVILRLKELSFQPRVVIIASKGIEQGSLCRMSEIVEQNFAAAVEVCALSGPSHAEEVSRGMPCSMVAASVNEATAQYVQKIFSTDRLRLYTSQDIIGVELGGALKNVIAIAAGVVDGLKLGDNAKAALITRGLAEIGRLGKALGARSETFAGLSGLGDLVVTCTSRHSRNRWVGEELGRGRKLSDILKHMEMVAEGVETTLSALQLAEQKQVEMPITVQVKRILFENVSLEETVSALMQRPQKTELEMPWF